MEYNIRNENADSGNAQQESNDVNAIKNDVNDGLFNDYIEDNTYQITRTEIKNYKDKSNEPPLWIKIICIFVIVGLVGSFIAIKSKEANKYNGYYEICTFIYEEEALDSAGFYLATGDFAYGGITIEKDKCSLFIIRGADISNVDGTIDIEGRSLKIDKNDIHIVGEYDPDEESITIQKDDVTYIFYKVDE